jgi:hypothetical protein
MKKTGYIQSYIGSEVTALPIPFAFLKVYDSEDRLLLSLRADENGMIYKTPLATPDRTDVPPYIRYRAVASAPQFTEKEIFVSFFADVTSYQTFLLSPAGKICENSQEN